MISFEDYKAFVAKRKSDEGDHKVYYLGHPAEEIKFREGDIVEFGMHTFPSGEFRPTLGVVIAVPSTLEQCWEKLKDFPNFEDVAGYAEHARVGYYSYLVAIGRYQPDLQHYYPVCLNNISHPSQPVSAEERAKLMDWYDQAVEVRKNYVAPGLEPEAEAYAARYKEIEPIAALEALAHVYVDQCGISRSARTVACDAAEQWMEILGLSDHRLAPFALCPILADDDTVRYYERQSFVEFIPLINDELAQHREMLGRYDICYLRPEDAADVANMVYTDYGDDTTRIALCYGIKLALEEEWKSNRKLRQFLGKR